MDRGLNNLSIYCLKRLFFPHLLFSISEDNENRFFVFWVPGFHHPSHFLFETFSFERGGSRGHAV